MADTVDFDVYLERAKKSGSQEPAHDFLHVKRVYQNAKAILQEQPADEEVVLLAAILHELFNYPKNHPESHLSGEVCAKLALQVLAEEGFPSERAEHVAACIRDHSFSKGVTPNSTEGKILQDADRLDAIGAIGIARCFATCSTMERPFYSEFDPFCKERTPDQSEYGLDHFYQKLFRIPETLHTEAAKRMANKRMEFMRDYILQLETEIKQG